MSMAPGRMRGGTPRPGNAKTFRVGAQDSGKPLQLVCHWDGPGPAWRGPARDGHPGLEQRDRISAESWVGSHQLRERDTPLNRLAHDPPDELMSLAERHTFLHQPLSQVGRAQRR